MVGFEQVDVTNPFGLAAVGSGNDVVHWAQLLLHGTWTMVLGMRWRRGATDKAFGLAINRSRVQILLEATLRNNLRQVVCTYVPLSPSSITWYRAKGR